MQFFTSCYYIPSLTDLYWRMMAYYVNMQHDYVNIRLIYVNMQYYVDMQK